LCAPVLAVLGLHYFFKADQTRQWKVLWQSSAIALGILVLLFVFKGSFDYSGGSDAYFKESYGPEFLEALKSDRKSMFLADLLRSGFFILLVSSLFWLHIKNRLVKNTTVILVGLLMVLDLFFIAKNYVSSNEFVSAREVDVPFQSTEADEMIMSDTTHYRVFEVDGNMSSARASYFHKSIGGYHAAKPRRMQQLFDYQIAKNNMEVLNMLNVKYVIQSDKEGKQIPTRNPEANGNAWFVQNVKFVQNPDNEMKALAEIPTKEVAVVNTKEYCDFQLKSNYTKDTLANIQLKEYKSNQIKYVSNNLHDGLAIFSEMYYENGWNAYVDGSKTPHLRANYVLRALQIPPGKHTIEFRFEPEVVKTGSTIALASSLGIVFLVVGGLYYERRKLWFSKEK
jgi:hypothetical protein